MKKNTKKNAQIEENYIQLRNWKRSTFIFTSNREIYTIYKMGMMHSKGVILLEAFLWMKEWLVGATNAEVYTALSIPRSTAHHTVAILGWIHYEVLVWSEPLDGRGHLPPSRMFYGLGSLLRGEVLSREINELRDELSFELNERWRFSSGKDLQNVGIVLSDFNDPVEYLLPPFIWLAVEDTVVAHILVGMVTAVHGHIILMDEAWFVDISAPLSLRHHLHRSRGGHSHTWFFVSPGYTHNPLVICHVSAGLQVLQLLRLQLHREIPPICVECPN